MPSALGLYIYIYVLNHEKKSGFKDISLKLATNGLVIRPFC